MSHLMSPLITWDLLLPTIVHRHAQMVKLLEEIDRQWQPGLGVIVNRDNLERPGNASYGKWPELLAASKAEYVSFIADDDWFAPDFVATIMKALEQRPDYVGFAVKYTHEGHYVMPVEHSLRHGGWENRPDILVRDIVHYNPIRRDLALLGSWRTDTMSADNYWAKELRESGKVQSEVWIPREMYYYQETGKSWARWMTHPEPLPENDILPLPEYPWLTTCGSVDLGKV